MSEDVMLVPHVTEENGKIHLGFDLLKDWQIDVSKIDKIDLDRQFSWLSAVFAKAFLDYALDDSDTRIKIDDRRKKNETKTDSRS